AELALPTIVAPSDEACPQHAGVLVWREGIRRQPRRNRGVSLSSLCRLFPRRQNLGRGQRQGRDRALGLSSPAPPAVSFPGPDHHGGVGNLRCRDLVEPPTPKGSNNIAQG